MTNLLVAPEVVATTVADIENIGSTVTAASAAAAAPTTGLLAAAADEVSAAIANLFGTHGLEFQALAGQVEAFQTTFRQTLAAAAQAYVQTEAASAAAIPPFAANLTSLFLGPTGVPIPSEGYVAKANELYVRANPFPPNVQLPLYTPENLYPITGVKSMTLNQSVVEGLTIMDNAIHSQLAIPGNSLTIFGYSQSAIIASLEMQKLAAMGSPYQGQLNFVLVGNEMNPNGGMLARFPGLTLPTLGLSFYGGTPSDTLYPTAIYTQEYDGFADFPRYPLNFISDLNAVMGIATVHVKYLDLSVADVNNAVPLATSPGYTGVTEYYMIRTENLPLLAPLRAIPVIGNPLAALVEPDLKVIVNLGYGDPYHGYSTSPADVRTPFGLFPDVSPATVVEALAAGTQQGIHDFTAELQALAAQPFTLPSFAPPQPADLMATLAALPSPEKIVNTAATVISTDYAVLLPTADTLLAFATTMPLYDSQLFLSQLAQGNLINAIGYPLAADVGLITIAGIVEFLVIAKAISENIKDISALIP
ncbi:PE family protein [Mycobacterium gordonae]|uniref:PE family protein n=1 Tax=Mycobacterium gordonae TaxID=1778 RepID=A0A1X1WYF1_MYCGO|nr:PE-PPE domain-containing protein [Mycobacterium gordonae]PJE19091.1 MAG: PE family protein [Mycobacterium sp.]MBX9979117.1 PE-PPE domain-containing protein [Mycobacterium gordonae]MCQ4361636.1 PE-PPE domain-containing protein [Mycobacterium gordonae]MCV7006494.1 PE-PPE domain-containing protein [Mycobacterium gordonae]ODR16866.1 PE family protein [Mycobacterium gordonae]